MKRLAIRALLLSGLLALVLDSARAQPAVQDSITVRTKDGGTKTYNGTLTLTPNGFQVVGSDKKVAATISPDDIVKFSVGELPGVDRDAIRAANSKEEKHEYDAARTIYADLLKKTGLPERSKRYLEYKKVLMTNKAVDEMDDGKGWAQKADECVKDWNSFLSAEETKFGWEQWPAVRACTRLEVERRKFDEAARAWGRVSKNKNMPPEAQQEAALQEIDLQIRAKQYAGAAAAAAEMAKSAAGARKDRLAIYEIAARAGSDGKFADGVEKIKAAMNKSKDSAVHATGYSMMGELDLAAGKPRDAMWMFLWVETVLNQDRDEALKAMARLTEIFEGQMDEDQVRKYHEKLKRFRTSY